MPDIRSSANRYRRSWTRADPVHSGKGYRIPRGSLGPSCLGYSQDLPALRWGVARPLVPVEAFREAEGREKAHLPVTICQLAQRVTRTRLDASPYEDVDGRPGAIPADPSLRESLAVRAGGPPRSNWRDGRGPPSPRAPHPGRVRASRRRSRPLGPERRPFDGPRHDVAGSLWKSEGS